MAAVLVVDDDADIRLLMEMALTAGGHAVEAADSADAALARLASHPFDVVITDLNLDESISGEELLRRIHGADGRARVILISGFAEMGEAERFRELGAVDFLAKPFDLRELVSAVGRAAGH